jgi:hypothetical protein
MCAIGLDCVSVTICDVCYMWCVLYVMCAIGLDLVSVTICDVCYRS